MNVSLKGELYGYLFAGALLLVFVVLLVLLVCVGAALAAKAPTKVMIVVMDQMRPEYAQQVRHDERAVAAEPRASNFPNAYVGDMASETVVSHNVMVSGLFPKHMGWSDEAIRDVDNVLGYGANAIVTGRRSRATANYVKLIQAPATTRSSATTCTPRSRAPSSPTSARRATRSSQWPPSSSDYWVRMGSKKNTADLTSPFSPASVPWIGTYRGAGGNAPSYITNDPATRSASATTWRPAAPNDYYGTKTDKPAWLYPEDGRYVPGPYPTNLSGDTWVADAAMEIMEARTEGLVRALHHLQRHRQDRSHVGRRRGRHPRDLQLDARHALRAGPHAVGRQDRRRPARPRHRRAQGQGRVRRDADHRHRGPRLHLRRQGRPRRQRVRRRQRRRLVRRHLVPRLHHADRAQHGQRSGGPQAAHGHRQDRVQLPVHRHRVVAQDGQPHVGRPSLRGARHEGPARRDRHLHQARRPLRACTPTAR